MMNDTGFGFGADRVRDSVHLLAATNRVDSRREEEQRSDPGSAEWWRRQDHL